MTRKPNEQGRETLPPGIPYGWPLGMVAVAALCYAGMWAYQHTNYTCVALRAMCEERERLESVERVTLGTVALPVPAPRLSLQLPPVPQEGWRKAEEGCPSHYRPINGACWIGVEEPPPCRTSYFHNGKCYAPLPATPKRPGVSDGAFR